MKYGFPLEDSNEQIKDGFYNVELCYDCEDPFYWSGANWPTRESAQRVQVSKTLYRIRVRVK